MSDAIYEKPELLHSDSSQAELQKDNAITFKDVDAANSHNKSKEERRLVLKQDLIIVPLLTMAYFFAYLDRGQIGNAKLMGITTSLHLTASEYYNCLTMFFVGFLVVELPAGLLLRIFPAQRVLGGAVIIFGVCATCVSVAGGYAGVMVLRTLLGMGEAVIGLGFIYLAMWYKRDELALRSGFFYVSTAFGGFASGLIAYGVAKNLNGVRGYHSWQWLFLTEGVPTIFWGLLIFFLLPDMPDKVAKKGSFTFSSPRERELMLIRVAAAQNHAGETIKLGQILLALKDIRTWLVAIMVAAPALGITAWITFLPTIVEAFDFTPLQAQLYSIIPYSFAIVTTIGMCFISDRFNSKAFPMLACITTSMVGLIIFFTTTRKIALMAGACLVAAGAYPGIPIGASWATTLYAGYTKKVTLFAVVMIFIQCYSIAATHAYTDPPRFFKGHGMVLGLNGLAFIATTILYFVVKSQNKKKEVVAQSFRDRGYPNPDSEKTLEELCDAHPDFRYPL